MSCHMKKKCFGTIHGPQAKVNFMIIGFTGLRALYVSLVQNSPHDDPFHMIVSLPKTYWCVLWIYFASAGFLACCEPLHSMFLDLSIHIPLRSMVRWCWLLLLSSNCVAFHCTKDQFSFHQQFDIVWMSWQYFDIEGCFSLSKLHL